MPLWFLAFSYALRVDWSASFLGIEIPKFVDTVTPQYKPKFDALVSTIYIQVDLSVLLSAKVPHSFVYMAAGRIEGSWSKIPKGVWAVGEGDCWSSRNEGMEKKSSFDFQFCRNEFSQPISLFSSEKDLHHDCWWILWEASRAEEEVWRWNPKWLLGLLIWKLRLVEEPKFQNLISWIFRDLFCCRCLVSNKTNQIVPPQFGCVCFQNHGDEID